MILWNESGKLYNTDLSLAGKLTPAFESYYPVGWSAEQDDRLDFINGNHTIIKKFGINEKRLLAKYLKKEGRWTHEKIKELQLLQEHTELTKAKEKALRNCWGTSEHVLMAARYFIGAFDCDPFYNPWSVVAKYMARGPVTVYTGSGEEDNGLICPWGDSNLVNGPYSKPKEWMELCAEVGKKKKVAAICPVNGAGWHHLIFEADLVIHLGREPFRAPPGITPSSPAGGTALCIWNPSEGREDTRYLSSQNVYIVERDGVQFATVAYEYELKKQDKILKVWPCLLGGVPSPYKRTKKA